jgi:Haem-binding domain
MKRLMSVGISLMALMLIGYASAGEQHRMGGQMHRTPWARRGNSRASTYKYAGETMRGERPIGKEFIMREWIVLSGLSVLVVLSAVQFIPIDTANPPVDSDIPTSPEVKAVLRRACYDCHSHETVWPWYSRIPPSPG